MGSRRGRTWRRETGEGAAGTGATTRIHPWNPVDLRRANGAWWMRKGIVLKEGFYNVTLATEFDEVCIGILRIIVDRTRGKLLYNVIWQV